MTRPKTPAGTKPARSDTPVSTHRLTYEPYVFALALLALLAKVAHSLASSKPVFDLVFWAFLSVFAVSSLLYWLQQRAGRPRPLSSITSSIATGSVTNSEITGVKSISSDSASSSIRTKDVKGSRITGVERTDKK